MDNKKHAYLIAAHNNIYILEKLIDLLDDPQNDLFVHIDIKCKMDEDWFNKIKPKYSKIFFIKRRSVMWAGYSQVNLTIDMLNEATKNGYLYYHLISGTSLPIKTQKEIHDFFDNDPNKPLYFHVNVENAKVIQDRAKAHYPFIESKRFRNSKLIKMISLIIGKIQIAFGVNRLKNNVLAPLFNGWSWFSIPDDFAKFLLTKKDLIKSTFHHTVASDEVWLHSVAAHSETFRPRTYGLNGRNDPIDASKHFQDWERGKPYTFRKEDYDLLMKNNPCFWARKFDVNVDKEIVDMIYEKIKKEQETPKVL